MDPEDLRNTVSLVRAAQGGDEPSLEELFTRYLPRVRHIVALRTGKRVRQFVGLDDIVQEVLLKVFRGLDRFEQRTEGSFRNWLAVCVECEIRDQRRRADAKKRGAGKVRRRGYHAQGSTFLSTIFKGKGPTPSQVVRGKELEIKIEEALLNMPKHYREAIILRRLCEMSYEDMAKTMGFGREETARKAFSRALKKLDEMLEED